MVKGLHQRRYESVCVGYEGIRLFLRIILAKGHKINIFGIQKKSYVFHIHPQAVIGGNEDQKRLVISQMRLGPHQNRCVRNPVCQFGGSIAGARQNRHNIQITLGAYRLRCPRFWPPVP